MASTKWLETCTNQESRAHSRGFNLPDDDAESNATEAAVATSAAVKEWLTSVQESVFVELVLSVHRFHAMANAIASFPQKKVVEYWNREHFIRMTRGQPGLGKVLPDEIARSRIAAIGRIKYCGCINGRPRELRASIFFAAKLSSTAPPTSPNTLCKKKVCTYCQSTRTALCSSGSSNKDWETQRGTVGNGTTGAADS
jgi:hypothetical protein